MKIKTICFLVIFPLYINAQSFWSVVVDNDIYNKSHVTDIGLFQDSIILVSGYVSDASCPFQRLFAYDFSGKKLWEADGYHDRIFIDSDYFFTAGYTPIDDIGGIEQIIISEFDKAGNEIFSAGYPPIPHEYFFDFTPVSIDIDEDGTIIVASLKSVVKSDFYGINITEKKLALPSEIRNVVSINPLTYLISVQNRIYKSDSSFILIDSISFTNSLIETVLQNDTIYTLFNSDLIQIDTSLSVIDTIINSKEDNFQNFEFYQGNLWIQTNDSASISLIKIQNKETIDTLFFNLLSHNTEFIVSNDNYTFIGNSFSDQICMYNFINPGSGTVHPEISDIEIVDFNINNVILDYIKGYEDTFAIGYFFDTELTLKNIGTETIKSFAVFSDLHGGFNCAQNYFYQKFTNVEIIPDQTLTVRLDRRYEEGTGNSKLCFECLAPNSGIESNISNNSLCKTFEIIGIPVIKKSHLKIYPNPASAFIFIDDQEVGLKGIELTDLCGRIILQLTSIDQIIKMDINSLTPGMYIIKLVTRKGIDSQVIVKE